MSILNNYLERCQSIKSLEELSSTTYNFILENNPSVDVTLILHQPKLNALQAINSTKKKSLDYWHGVLSNGIFLKNDRIFFETENHLFYFSDNKFITNTVYIFIVNSATDDTTKQVLKAWQSSMQLLKTISICSEQKNQNHYGNLISQLLHDVHSLIELGSKNDQQKELLKKIAYQKQINKDLLFYIRDFDLFKSDLSVNTFIKDSLSLINVDIKEISFDAPNPDFEIFIDVELFSEALNQIFQNAIDAVSSDLSKIKLNISLLPSSSPFLKSNWVVFELEDDGKGISKEFLPHITNPFFTTQKYKNNSGFGLTNAQKIINGHFGYLEISSKNGVNVKIFIPQSEYEEK